MKTPPEEIQKLMRHTGLITHCVGTEEYGPIEIKNFIEIIKFPLFSFFGHTKTDSYQYTIKP